ncbi:MAG: RecX family transcriptional regulator [Lachnospiraceae bacterium]|nr:RecX family transcriptional regulator [Lachnospiraceae bacterium]
MIVTNIEYHTKTKVKVSLDNREDFQLYRGEIKKYGIEEGVELTNYDEILRETLIPRAKKRTMHLLAKMDRTKADITKKLRDNGYPAEAIAEAIAFVESYDYINDLRYAYMYVRNYRTTRSRNRIMQDMYRKGLNRDIINDAIDKEYTTNEEDLINMYIRKRNFNHESATIKDKEKMCRFLLGKGFEIDMIHKALM